jgi:hypothetical protein
MKRPSGGMLVVGFFALLFVVVLWVHAHQASHSQAATLATTPTPTPQSTASPTGEKEKGADAPSNAAIKRLNSRAATFLSDFYLLRTTDSGTSRRDRVGKFGPPDVINRLPLGLSTGTPADKARIRLGLLQRGIPVMSKMKVSPATDEPIDKLVSVPVEIVVTRRDGTEVSRITKQTVAWWEYINHQWTLQRFTPPY